MSPTTIIGLVCLLLGLATGWGGRALVADAEIARLASKHADAVAQQSQDAQQREAKARTEERRVTRNVMEAADAANLKAADARRSAAAVAGERDRLRDAYIDVATRAGGPTEATPVAAGGPPATGAGLVLTRLFDGADALLRSCSAALDQSRVAGLTCERAYDAIASDP